jgi:hypothetical protein
MMTGKFPLEVCAAKSGEILLFVAEKPLTELRKIKAMSKLRNLKRDI